MYKGELGTANAHKILLKDIGKLFLPEAPVPHCTSIKQWGKAVGTNISVVNFPIAFASTPYVGYLTRTASGNSGNNTVIVRNITKTQLYGEFAYGGSDKGVYWLVIGK